MRPLVFGLLRIRNEARWIEDVIASILPICGHVFVLDDHSTDGTPELCEAFDGVTVVRSPLAGLDESRDKDYLLGLVMDRIPGQFLCGDPNSPFWALAIDGDEVLDPGGPAAIRAAVDETASHAFKLPVRYLWNSGRNLIPQQRQIRVDGVYAAFARPSLFRICNRQFRYLGTPWGGNLHCSSIPQQLLHGASGTLEDAPLWHLGYNDRADRLRKHDWYNKVDPGNQGEDCYRHCIQGDLAEVPATARLLHAGPLRLITV